MRLLARSLTTVAVIVIAGGLLVLAMETYQWSQEPSTTATVQAVVAKCSMSYRVGKGTGKKSIVDCDQVDAIRKGAPDLDWTVRQVKVATLSYRSGDGKLVFGDYALSRLNLSDAAVGDHVTVYYRPGHPDFIKGPPNLVWFFGLSKLLGLGVAILLGAWLARRIAHWLLTEEEHIALQAIAKAQASYTVTERLASAARILPLFLFGQITFYGALVVLILAGAGYGLKTFADRTTEPATATVTSVRETCTLYYKTGSISWTEKKVACGDIAAEKAKLPEVQWRTERKTTVGLVYLSADGTRHEATKSDHRSIDKAPAVGAQVAIRYNPKRPQTVFMANAGLVRSLQWILAVAGGFFLVGLVARPFLKRAERREKEDFQNKAQEALVSMMTHKILEDAGFFEAGVARPAAGQHPTAGPARAPSGGFGRRASA